eukprot:9050161-Pyramimonas_sp.AAC.1
MSARQSHVPWPHRSSTERPSGRVHVQLRHPLRHAPHTLHGLSIDSPCGCVHMRSRHSFRHAPHTLPGPMRNFTERRSGRVHMRSRHPF